MANEQSVIFVSSSMATMKQETTATAVSDARLDFALEILKGREDNHQLISVRTTSVHAETAVLKPVDLSVSIPLKMGEVRCDFAHYLHEMLGANEALTEAHFNYLREEFLADKFANDNSYIHLKEREQGWCRAAIDSCEDAYFQAFSDMFYDLSKTTLPTPIEAMQTFCSMPETLDDAFRCYELFCADPQYGPIVANLSDEGRYATFRVARLARGVNETPESSRAIASLASFLDLAA